MAFPEKFRHLIEIELKDVDIPDYVLIVYAVCAIHPDSCGWSGWVIDSVWKINPENSRETFLPALSEQVCPVCGKDIFRTAAELRMERSAIQIDRLQSIDVAPIEFE